MNRVSSAYWQTMMRCAQVVLIFILTACSTNLYQPQIIPENLRQRAWDKHQIQLAQIKSWNLAGKLGIRAPDKAISASLIWHQQTKYRFQLQLSGPLGTGRTSIKALPGYVVLYTNDGKTLTAANAETLLFNATQWQLPLNNLYYWVRGLPAANMPITKQQLNPYGYLAMLEQGDWQISYTNYQNFKQSLIPRKVKIRSDKLAVTLIIKNLQ